MRPSPNLVLVLLNASALSLGAGCGAGGDIGEGRETEPLAGAEAAVTAPIDAPARRSAAIRVTEAGSGIGTVTSFPAGIACGRACSARFPGGATVTLLATAHHGSRFVGWSGACSGLRNPCTVVVDAAASVTANFSHGGSGLPVPNGGGIARPIGRHGNLRVLDWAGFKGAVSYSFDDAFPSQVAGDNYDVIHATGIPVTYYIVPSQADLNVAAWRRVRAGGNEIGNHTLNHCFIQDGALTGCLYGGAAAQGDTPVSQITDATSYIEDTLGASGVWTMAGPYGDTGWGTPAEEAHMLINRDVDYSASQTAIHPGDITNRFHAPSYLFGDQYGGLGQTTEAINGRIDAARTDGIWYIFLFHSLSPVATPDVSTCCEVPAANVAASLDHINSLGDVWGGPVVDVGAYWIGQVVVQQADGVTRHGVTTWTWELPAGFPPGKYVRVTVDGGALSQGRKDLVWDEHGYYEVALDARELTLK